MSETKEAREPYDYIASVGNEFFKLEGELERVELVAEHFER
jgi:hypothetical protein